MGKFESQLGTDNNCARLVPLVEIWEEVHEPVSILICAR